MTSRLRSGTISGYGSSATEGIVSAPTLAAPDPAMGAQAPGIGFAIDSNTVRTVADTLVRSG